jgi:hypothetical protein
VDNSDHERIYIQSLDSLGNRNFGEMGSMLNSVTDPGTYQYINTTPCEDGGCISVFDINFYDYNVWAKRCNEDGTLGGPLPPVEDVVIHISGDDIVLTWPSQGDSMQYNIFKSTEPYKFNLINPDTTISDTVFVDVNALSEEMKYYNVTFEMMNKIK